MLYACVDNVPTNIRKPKISDFASGMAVPVRDLDQDIPLDFIGR